MRMALAALPAYSQVVNEAPHSPALPGRATGPAAMMEAEVEYASDPVIAVFKKDVDRTLLVDNLRRTFDQRARRMNEFIRALDTLRAQRPARRP